MHYHYPVFAVQAFSDKGELTLGLQIYQELIIHVCRLVQLSAWSENDLCKYTPQHEEIYREKQECGIT